MKTFKTFAMALGAAVLCASGLYAQSVTVDVPFDFTVQSAAMPAGQYQLSALSATSQLIQIRNRDTGRSVVVLAPNPDSTGHKDTTTGKVIFHRCGDRYFFSEVWTVSLQGRALPSKLEREYRSNGAEKSLAVISIPVATRTVATR